jgi:predicted enzyme related to lactoylglutathione lyase
MEDTMGNPRLRSIIIGTADIKKAKEFYIAVFGITIESEEAVYISSYGVDGTHIEIESDSEFRFPNWKEHNVGTYKNTEFAVADMELFLAKVEKNGGKIVSKPVMKPWGNISAEIADLDGNIFAVSQ